MFFLLPTFMLAQDPSVFPDEKRGKFALIKKVDGKKVPITDYVYDYINDGWTATVDKNEKGRFFSCKQGVSWGVLNEEGKYQIELRELDTLWLLRSGDAYKLVRPEGVYDYVNLKGEVIATDIVTEQRSPYARYRVLVKSDGNQSIIYKGKEVMKPIPFELDLEIQNLARTFLVRNSKGFYVINLDGLPLNEKPYEGATAIDFNGNLAVKSEGAWRVLDRNLAPVDDNVYSKIDRKESQISKRYFYLCTKNGEDGYYIYAGDFPTLVTAEPVTEFTHEKSFGLGYRNNKWGVLPSETLKWTEFKYDEFKRTEKHEAYFHLLFCKMGEKYVIVDEDGNEYYSELGLTDVYPLTCDGGAKLVLKKGDKVALVHDPNDDSNPVFEFQEAQCHDKGILVKKNDKWGIVGFDGNMLVECKFNSPEEVAP